MFAEIRFAADSINKIAIGVIFVIVINLLEPISTSIQGRMGALILGGTIDAHAGVLNGILKL